MNYALTYSTELNNILPVRKRKPKTQALLSTLLYPLQWLHDNFFTEYVTGSAASFFSGAGTYVNGDKVIDIDNGVYQVYDQTKFVAAGGGGFTNPYTNPLAWVLISSDYRGVYERTNYNGQKLMLEFILNKFFRTTFTQPPQLTLPDIYITSHPLNNNVFIAQDNPAFSSAVYASDIYSQNFVFDTYSFSANAFTINIKTAQYNALLPYADEKIRAVADRYVMAGVKYNISTY